jgi:hypothetical protein
MSRFDPEKFLAQIERERIDTNKPEKRAEIDRAGFITSGDVGYIDEDGYVLSATASATW